MSERDNALQESLNNNGASGPWRRVLIAALVLGAVIALALLLRSFLAAPEARKSSVQQIALLKQPPPPPPPKPQEKPPEPPKVKEEVKIEQPKVDPQPDQPKAADEKPPSDKPLGVDAEGGAGADGFGLAGNKGGRDLLATGAGGRGAYFSGLLQRHFVEALSRNRSLLKEEFRIVVRIWLGDDGRVQRADIVTGSGNAEIDEQVQATLAQMAPLREVPPASMRPMQLRLVNRS